jgi:glycosyltransferase involved in cell wall biosynthesis
VSREQLSTRGDSLSSSAISGGRVLSAIALKDDSITAPAPTGRESSQEVTANRELRVLQVFDGLGIGGAETWLMSLLKYFHEQNQHAPLQVKFDVLLTGGERRMLDDEAKALGARLFYQPFTRRTLPQFVREFRKILANGNYDAIHDHQDYISGLHFMMGAGHLPPVRIAHVHNPLYHRKNSSHGFAKRAVNRLGKHFVGRFATHVMGTSRQIVTEYGFDDLSERITLGAAHCGLDVSRYQGDHEAVHAELCREFDWDTSAKILLFVGRLDGAEFVYHGHHMSHKNPAFALETAKACSERDDRIKLLMVGAGAEKREEFEDQVRGWGMNNDIRFLGTRADVPRLMMGSDLLLFPSVAEGLGMVVVEAQAAGLPVLASDTTPEECVVSKAIVTFLSLEKPPEVWAVEALRITALPRPDVRDSNLLVSSSPFSIEHSANLLQSLYGSQPKVSARFA